MSPDKPCILLVEDDAALVDALSFAFGLEGFQVRAYSKPEALLESDVPPEAACLVVDLILPGMDGIALIDRLRQDGVELPAVLITTQPTQQVRKEAAARGLDIIEKPLLTDALLQHVRALIAA